MKLDKEKSVNANKVLALIACLLTSIITLWLIASPLNYILYLFEVTLIMILFYTFFGKTTSIQITALDTHVTKADYAFVVTSFLLIILNFLKTESIMTFMCALIVSFFLPGYVVLRLLNFQSSHSWIEWIALSFSLSVGVTSVIFVGTLPFTPNNSTLSSILFSCLALCPLIKDKICTTCEKQLYPERHSTKHNLSDVLLFLWIIIFFVFSISCLYPQMSICPKLDIVRHFSSSKLLATNPTSFSSNYFWFHTMCANVYELSNPSIEVFQTGLACLSVMAIFSFYVMAKNYLHNIDKRAAILATVFFSIFAGFGWLYFLQARITTSDASVYYNLLIDAFNKSYFDAGYAQGWIWFWFRPLTLGLTLFFVLLYMLRNQSLSKKKFIFAFTFLSVTLMFVHFSESIVFVVFLFFLTFLKPLNGLRLGEAAISSTLAMFVSLPLLYVCQYAIGTSLTIGPPSSYLIFLAMLNVLSFLITRIKTRPRLLACQNIRWIVVGTSVIYVWLLLLWFNASNSFDISSVTEVYGVPWQFYPILLGSIGMFALIASLIITNSYSKKPVVTFLLLLFFAVLFGRFLTFYNVNVGNSSYFERRIVPIAYAASAVIAPIAIIELFKRIQNYKPVVLSTLLSFLVIMSISSTFLSLDLQLYVSNVSALSDHELDLVNNLNELSANKVLLTFTDDSKSLAEFSPSCWTVDKYRYPLWSAKCPELPLNVLYSMNIPVTFFLQEDDIHKIDETCDGSYLRNSLLSSLSENDSQAFEEIMLAPDLVAPSSDSQTILVLTDYDDSVMLYVYDLLSQANLDYTTALIDDLYTLSQAETLIAPTESIAQQLIAYRKSIPLKFENIIILNLDGYGDLSSSYFSSKMMLSLDEESQRLATLNLNGVAVENISLIGAPTEFELKSTSERSELCVLLDEDFENWTCGGLGVGSISAPCLTLNRSIGTSKNQSIQIDVTSGTYGYWQIKKDFTTDVDFSSFDFISFDWYGLGNNQKYVIQYHSTPLSNYWYSFTDSWNGWKTVTIPLRIPDGSYNLTGVSFVKFTNGEPSWNSISQIDIRTEGSNPDLSGTFSIAQFGFESATTINVVIMTNSSCNFELFNFDNAHWNDIAYFSVNATSSVTNHVAVYTFNNGLNSTMLFGNGSHITTNATIMPDHSISTISFKIPPHSSDWDLGGIRLKIVPAQDIEFSEIVNSTSVIDLKTNVSATFLETTNPVVAFYKNSEQTTPFAIEINELDFKIVYVNIYPLITNFDSLMNNYDAFLLTVSFLNISEMINDAKVIAENPVHGNLVAFNSVDFEGEITFSSQSSVIINSVDNPLVLTSSNLTMTDLSKVVFTGGNIILSTKECCIDGGVGFYSDVYSTELSVSSINGTVDMMILEFFNGTTLLIEEPIYNIYVSGHSVTTLRQPNFNVDGNVTLHDFYTYASLSHLGIFAKDTTLEGTLNFDVKFGDEFTIATNFEYSGKITTNKHYYDELSLLGRSLPLLLVTCTSFIFVYALVKLPVKNKNQTEV